VLLTLLDRNTAEQVLAAQPLTSSQPLTGGRPIIDIEDLREVDFDAELADHLQELHDEALPGREAAIDAQAHRGDTPRRSKHRLRLCRTQRPARPSRRRSRPLPSDRHRR